MSEIDGEREQNIKVRERLIEMDIDRFYTLTIDSFKWAAAATLSINGAPLIAMLGSDSLRNLLPGPGIAFSIGLAFSIFGNLLLVKGFAEAGEKLFLEHWSGEAVKKDNFDDVAPDSDSNRWTVIAAILLGLSIGSFLVGMIWMGNSVGD